MERLPQVHPGPRLPPPGLGEGLSGGIHSSVLERLPGGLGLGPSLDPAASGFRRNWGFTVSFPLPQIPGP